MLRSRSALVLAAALAAFARPALAHQTYYTSYCQSCHGTTVQTCNGCHAHGTHADTSKATINLAGTLDATSYAPGATVTVTIAGGYRSGWARAVLLDATMTQLAASSCPGAMGGCSTIDYPVTLTAKAPTAAGTYRWAIAWYGNFQYEGTGASFGTGQSTTLQAGAFTPDAHNPNHGWQVVALPAFTVTGTTPPPPPPPASTPAIALTPASLDLGSVAIGSSAQGAAQLQNTGSATLTVTSIDACAGTATTSELGWSVAAAPFTIAPGASVALTVTYAPLDAGADAGCVAIASDDPQHPTVELTLSGTGTDPGTTTPPPGGTPPPPTTDPSKPSSGGCSTGSDATGAAAILGLGLVAMHLASRRRAAVRVRARR